MRNLRFLTALGLALAVLGASLPQASAAGAPAMKFGMDKNAVQALANAGARPDYAQLWAGVWNERSGWGSLGTDADRLADQGVVPVVEWWYWGDDITQSCVTNGCWSNLHDAQKSRAKWAEDARRLADALHSGLQGRAGIVVLESEFNKANVQAWEALDGYLADHAAIFRARAPELKLVLGFGNWNPQHWGTFDRAVAQMDLVGLQTMRGSTRDSLDRYLGAVDAMVDGAQRLQARFGKGVLLHDVALSSHPDSTYKARQGQVVQEMFQRLGELKGAGVRGIVYRSLNDSPGMDTANYYGEAERHWGLRLPSGAWKPALDDWVRGVKAERAHPVAAGSSSAPPASTWAPSFQPRSVGNDWWVEVAVGAGAPDRVAAKVGDGPWTSLTRTSWGTWADDLHAVNGSPVQFRATSSAGQIATSSVVTWT